MKDIELPVLEVIISTFGVRIYNITLPPPHRQVRYLIIHQAHNKIIPNKITMLTNREDVNYVKSDTIGLTKSRNHGLSISKSKLKLISDDDVLYADDFYNVIIESYHSLKFDVGLFKAKILNTNKDFRLYPPKEGKISKIDCLHACSIEIVITDNVNEKFNERFGLGGDFICCEESVFLIDCYRRGKRLFFSNKDIVYHPEESTATKVNKNVVMAKGALYRYAFGSIISLIFILRLSGYSDFPRKSGISRVKTLGWLLAGWKNV